MKNAQDNRFGTILLFCFLIWTFLFIVLRKVLKKRGVDVDSEKNFLILVFGLSPIIFLPFWLDPLSSIQIKIIITVAGLIAGILNYYSVKIGGKRLRKTLGIETKGDIEEREREEKAKKEKEEICPK